jgi:hypothetical protein
LGIPTTAFTIPKLDPGASRTVTKFGTISANLINTVTAVGRPDYYSGAIIPGYPDVAATHPSGVKMIAYSANITIDNTVYIGNNGARECPGAGVKKVTDFENTTAAYCFIDYQYW